MRSTVLLFFSDTLQIFCFACQLSRTYPRLFLEGGHSYIVDTLVLQCFVHSYCVIPSNIPFVIQRDVLVCEQCDRRHDSLQTYITAVGRCFLWRIRTPNALVRRHSNSEFDIPNSALRVSDFTPKCIGVFIVYLNITERSSQLRVLLESY